MTNPLKFQAALEAMSESFQKAASERKKRPGMVDDDGVMEPEWAIFERGEMLKAVNNLRWKNGYPPIGIEEVTRVERMACGHVDYAHKFAIYCTELGFNYQNIKP